MYTTFIDYADKEYPDDCKYTGEIAVAGKGEPTGTFLVTADAGEYYKGAYHTLTSEAKDEKTTKIEFAA